MSSMAGSQTVQRDGIGGKARQDGGAGKDIKDVKHCGLLQNGVP